MIFLLRQTITSQNSKSRRIHKKKLSTKEICNATLNCYCGADQVQNVLWLWLIRVQESRSITTDWIDALSANEIKVFRVEFLFLFIQSNTNKSFFCLRSVSLNSVNRMCHQNRWALFVYCRCNLSVTAYCTPTNCAASAATIFIIWERVCLSLSIDKLTPLNNN